jgi:hypothetical protein
MEASRLMKVSDAPEVQRPGNNLERLPRALIMGTSPTQVGQHSQTQTVSDDTSARDRWRLWRD